MKKRISVLSKGQQDGRHLFAVNVVVVHNEGFLCRRSDSRCHNTTYQHKVHSWPPEHQQSGLQSPQSEYNRRGKFQWLKWCANENILNKTISCVTNQIYQSASPEVKAMVDSGRVRIEIRNFFPGSVMVNFTIVFIPSQSLDISNVSTAVLQSLTNSSTYTVDQNSTSLNGTCLYIAYSFFFILYF